MLANMSVDWKVVLWVAQTVDLMVVLLVVLSVGNSVDLMVVQKVEESVGKKVELWALSKVGLLAELMAEQLVAKLAAD